MVCFGWGIHLQIEVRLKSRWLRWSSWKVFIRPPSCLWNQQRLITHINQADQLNHSKIVLNSWSQVNLRKRCASLRRSSLKGRSVCHLCDHQEEPTQHQVLAHRLHSPLQHKLAELINIQFSNWHVLALMTQRKNEDVMDAGVYPRQADFECFPG